MRQTISKIVISLFIASCGLGPKKQYNYTRIENGLYYYGDLFVMVDSSLAFPYYFNVSQGNAYFRDAFKDTLIKQNDTTFKGKVSMLNLSGGRIYYDMYFNPKRLYPVRLEKADSSQWKKWSTYYRKATMNEID